jgi:tetratricopeptide (TPR) repeat protein
LFFSWKAEAQILSNDVDGAKESLLQAKKTIDQHDFLPPAYLMPYCIAQFLMDIYLLRDAIVSNESHNISKLKKKAHHTGKRLLSIYKKYPIDCVKDLQLMGEYYWLIGKQKNALKWWDRAIKKGEELGARPDLSRTYFEIGKSLLETNSKTKELNGIPANEYLEKARTLFEEMDLQWDLDELERILCK